MARDPDSSRLMFIASLHFRHDTIMLHSRRIHPDKENDVAPLRTAKTPGPRKGLAAPAGKQRLVQTAKDTNRFLVSKNSKEAGIESPGIGNTIYFLFVRS
jgi:hypothetical protein